MLSNAFPWSFGAAIVGSLVYGVIMAVRYRKSEVWPAADGLIETLIEIRSVGNHGPYYGVLSYSYQVADEYYSGEWMTPSFPKRSDVSEFVEKQMAKGTKVTVKYHPRHPDRSVLEIDIAMKIGRASCREGGKDKEAD